MTDERLGDTLWMAIDRLPRGSGIIVRDYARTFAARAALFGRIRRRAVAGGHIVIRAGPQRLGRGEAGVHGRDAKRAPGLKSWPAHNRREVVAGIRAGAAVIFISPVFATRSHPGGRALGPMRAAAMIRPMPRASRRPVFIALGGMNAARFKRLGNLGFAGWGAINGWVQAKITSPAPRATRSHA